MAERDQESTAAISIRTGDALAELGQYDDARTCYMAAVMEAAKPGPNGNMDYASLGLSMNAVARCFFRQGRFDEAREWYERAAEAKDIVNPPVYHESRGVSLNQAGVCLMCVEKYEEAVRWFTRALEAKEKGNAEGRIATILRLGAQCLGQPGRSMEAQLREKKVAAADWNASG
jgi:pentatricopeptide repeat protein